MKEIVFEKHNPIITTNDLIKKDIPKEYLVKLIDRWGHHLLQGVSYDRLWTNSVLHIEPKISGWLKENFKLEKENMLYYQDFFSEFNKYYNNFIIIAQDIQTKNIFKIIKNEKDDTYMFVCLNDSKLEHQLFFTSLARLHEYIKIQSNIFSFYLFDSYAEKQEFFNLNMKSEKDIRTETLQEIEELINYIANSTIMGIAPISPESCGKLEGINYFRYEILAELIKKNMRRDKYDSN